MFRGGVEGVRCIQCHRELLSTSGLYALLMGIAPVVFAASFVFLGRNFELSALVEVIAAVGIGLPATLLLLYFLMPLRAKSGRVDRK